MVVCHFVLAEALSAIAGVQVKHHSHIDDKEKAWKLHVKHLPAVALLGHRPHHFLTLAASAPESESADEALRKEIFMIPEEFFDPAYDFDFTNKCGSDDRCMRGDEPYQRPYGWKRFALNVLNEYPDGNQWLGSKGWRSCSSPGEWPVSFHGTSLKGAEGIIQTHYKPGGRMVYGRGIYSTPDIRVANPYCTKFTSEKNGKTYRVILQNRINPQKRTITSREKYWLVKVPEGTSPEQEREIVESAIRPYGLLLQEVKK